MTTPYISIKSVIYDLVLTISDRDFNENTALQWATHALRKLNISDVLVPAVAQIQVTDHFAQLPAGFKYLTQIAKYIGNGTELAEITGQDLPQATTFDIYRLPIEGLKWQAMYATSNPYHNSVCLNESLTSCTNCKSEFKLNENNTITTTFESGVIMMAYLAYPVDSEGYAMIPDDENIKEAILYYILYRYWMRKAEMLAKGAFEQRDYYLKMWQTHSVKATNLNLPDIGQLENMKNQFNRLVPRTNRFDQLFLTLSNSENVSF